MLVVTPFFIEVIRPAMNTKQRVFAALESIPNDASLDVVIDRLYLLRKIELGIAEADTDAVIDHDEFMHTVASEDATQT